MRVDAAPIETLRNGIPLMNSSGTTSGAATACWLNAAASMRL